MMNLGMNYNQYPMTSQPQQGHQQQYPMSSNYQMSPNMMTQQQRAMQDAQMIQQQEPQSLMSAAWDNSMDRYQNTFDDVRDTWNSSDGLMGFYEDMSKKGYQDVQSRTPSLPSLADIGYRSYG